MDYARLVAVLIEGMKEQQKEIEALKARVEAMEKRPNPPAPFPEGGQGSRPHGSDRLGGGGAGMPSARR
ncbi:MAG: hypothetical protein A3F84_23550 [Candidatus Handelsmanbacteria bacterium RIFCSPLOWO2_12_FULL_64_10]|uniref:Peptidase S74 domain-containing protein n=1 Tax=Handelsmanbacteria sp. (strain RIFCSPLOWO2_12_FULL_64_10) TaxID=1817868 RepID=A0A1F6CRG4_HANXR|nr:MAG: hypothetical protein A3F84_23550 [Candidatus Handelsmanbacteria bacterium RIFCSPLOWO2_12_FULL_64_10]